MREKTCCFTGHRELSGATQERLYSAIYDAVLSLLSKGVTEFHSGGALGFDTAAAFVVLDVKKLHPEVRLVLDLPCASQSNAWKTEDKKVYEYLLAVADETHILAPYYYKGCMQMRNRHMVDQSAYVICYCTKSTGGSAYTIRYAKELGCEIIDLSGL